MSKVFGSPHDVWWVMVRTLLLYATAVACFRVGQRRTLAEMSAFDFVAAVAAGAIVGRVPSAHDAGYLAGAATLVTILVAHQLTSRLRFRPLFARLIDHPPRLLVADGQVLEAELRHCGLTRQDLYGMLRERGVADLAVVRYAVFEPRGTVSIVRRTDTTDPELLRDLS
ncbi:MAG TPA: YetF domain-containing protein [Dactylosporangium sp.]|nr:YetF domain-containing protein [Dactylosporangium sp.]